MIYPGYSSRRKDNLLIMANMLVKAAKCSEILGNEGGHLRG